MHSLVRHSKTLSASGPFSRFESTFLEILFNGLRIVLHSSFCDQGDLFCLLTFVRFQKYNWLPVTLVLTHKVRGGAISYKGGDTTSLPR